MDIKAEISKAAERIAKDKDLQQLFAKDPVKAVEKVIGVDLPDDLVNKAVNGIKAKLTADKVSGAVDTIKDFLK